MDQWSSISQWRKCVLDPLMDAGGFINHHKTPIRYIFHFSSHIVSNVWYLGMPRTPLLWTKCFFYVSRMINSPFLYIVNYGNDEGSSIRDLVASSIHCRFLHVSVPKLFSSRRNFLKDPRRKKLKSSLKTIKPQTTTEGKQCSRGLRQRHLLLFLIAARFSKYCLGLLVA